jgi:hypothetical protein
VHDYSDDTFLVLQGQVDIRQGDSRRHLGTGHAAFVPNGQIHGTITTGTAKALLISFQAPPDLKLYSGESDSSKPGAKPPVGVITPGAVQLLEFQNKNGFFLHRGLGSQRVAVAYRTLKPAEEFQADLPVSGEGLLFVWKGGVTVQQGQSRHLLEVTNLLFATNAGKVLVKNTTAAPSIVCGAVATRRKPSQVTHDPGPDAAQNLPGSHNRHAGAAPPVADGRSR